MMDLFLQPVRIMPLAAISSSGAFLSGVAVRLVLVLSLWHAPLPWVHSHAVAESADGHSHALSRHVHALHAEDLEHGATHIAWHWHLVLPWCVEGETRCPSDDPSDDEGHIGFAMKFGVATSASQQMAHDVGGLANDAFGCDGIAAACLTATSFADTSHADPQRHRGRHFLETFGQTVSAAELLGVRLC